jgi:DNA-binding PadR family transcriptional regulator
MANESGPMTEAMYYVLLSLIRPNHGYQLMEEINKLSKGRIGMGPGTLYGVLTRMEKDRLIKVINDDGRRKTYQITNEGKGALIQEYNRLKNLVADGSLLEGEVN